jgi:hypothetical protein
MKGIASLSACPIQVLEVKGEEVRELSFERFTVILRSPERQ